MIGLAAIAAGYAWLAWTFGWWGAAVGAVHIGLMLAATVIPWKD